MKKITVFLLPALLCGCFDRDLTYDEVVALENKCKAAGLESDTRITFPHFSGTQQVRCKHGDTWYDAEGVSQTKEKTK